MSAAPPVYAQARAETAAMLGYDLANLSAEQATRLDVAAALRLAVDDQSGKLARGETADVTKLLSASEALARLLPPLREPPAASNCPDPRQIMFDTYMAMRKRGAAFGQGYDGLKVENERLKARIAELEAGGVPAPGEPTLASSLPPNVVPMRHATSESSAIATREDRTTSRDPPKPAPQPQAANMVDLRAGYSDGPAEPWRDYLNRNFDPWADNRR
jgi:hypothetical protein